MPVAGLSIGYARVSTEAQDRTSQREALAVLGMAPDRVYVDHGLTGTNRERPGLRQALAACRTGDTLVVTKLDRLALPRGEVLERIVDADRLARDLLAVLVDGKVGSIVLE